MWRHGAPVVVLLLGALALALWRGSPRFGPAAGSTDAARRSLAEQILGTGRFTLRFGAGRALHAAAVRSLRETAERHLSGFRPLGAEERMALLASNTRLDQEALTAAINRHRSPPSTRAAQTHCVARDGAAQNYLRSDFMQVEANTITRAAELLGRLRETIGQAMVGQPAVVEQVLVALVASGTS